MTQQPSVAHRNMATAPAGEFVMGSDLHYPEERPTHPEQVNGFKLDDHPVTNAEFRRFIRDSGYVTVAERPLDRADFPDASDEQLEPGSLVFQPTQGPVPLDDWERWWQWTSGACWQHPVGPETNLNGLDRHPVVHVAFEDAVAYAAWADKRLPTEVEWEYASRAGRAGTEYAWGDELTPRGRLMANTWHGRFPWERLAPSEARTTPIGRYRPNDWGLVDMIGNVWEWTATPWTPDHSGMSGPSVAPAEMVHACCAVSHTPAPEAAAALAETERRVIKGGSHLCAPSYCQRYRPAARQGHAIRSSTSHVGFRCAAD
jgi:sulfatase modifying factor 1